MVSPYPITRYTRADRSELLEFLTRVYPPTESAHHSIQWDWKYDKNPLNRAQEPFLLLLRDGATLIGMLGAIPFCIAVQGTKYPIVHACDLIIERAYRGERLSERLLTEYMRVNPVGYGWLNERSHRRASALKRTGWKRMTPLVKPFKPLALIRDITGKTPGRSESNPRSSAPPAISDLSLTSQIDIIISQIFNFDARFDALWNSVRVQFPVIGARDSHFLNWRYAQRPDVRYLTLTATKSDDLLGYLIVRLTEKNRMSFGYFVDIAVTNDAADAASLLIRAGCKFLQAYGASAVKCLITTPPWRRRFYAHGFLPHFWGAQPYFHSRSDRTESFWDTYRNVNNWFLTMGDGDFEISL